MSATNKLRFFVVGSVITFIVTLAGLALIRLPNQGMVVLIAVAAGVIAGIPTSLLVTWLATRSPVILAPPVDASAVQPAPAPERPAQRIIVVQPAAPAHPHWPTATPTGSAQHTPPPGTRSGPRRFTYYGTEDAGE